MRHNRIWFMIISAALCASAMAGCGEASAGDQKGQDIPATLATSASGAAKNETGDQDAGQRETMEEILVPEAAGEDVYTSDGVTIDSSNASDGYIMVTYEGEAGKVKMQITAPDEVQYTYTLTIGTTETFPLVADSGEYTVDVYENVYDSKYALICSESLDVTIEDELKPFLYPNQYVWFEQEDEPVVFARELSEESSDDLDYVEAVYSYVIQNISYDKEKANNVTAGYLPDISETMESGQGICFDFASLMAAMLRSQGVPTKLQVGYSGDAYHAWISVYLEEIGWVDNIIEFDGKNWSLVDPTLAASNDAGDVKDYIGDGENYILKYSY